MKFKSDIGLDSNKLSNASEKNRAAFVAREHMQANNKKMTL